MRLTTARRGGRRALAAAGLLAAASGCAGEEWPTLAAPRAVPAPAAPAPVAVPEPRPAAAPLPADVAADLRARLPGLVDSFATRILDAETVYSRARAAAAASGEGADWRATEMALSRLGQVASELAAELRALEGLVASMPGDREAATGIAARLADMHELLSARLAEERRAIASVRPPA